MYEEHHPDSPLVECMWQARATQDEHYLVSAVEYWDLWFTRSTTGELGAGLGGSSMGHRWIRSQIGEHSWGVQLKAHVVMPGVEKQLLTDGEQQLTVKAGQVVIVGHTVRFPEFTDLQSFADRLAELDVLRSDDEVRRMARTIDADGLLLQAEVRVGTTTIMLAERKPDWPFTPSLLLVYVNDLDATLKRALARGARLVTKPTDFFGTQFARVQDAEANLWWI